MSVQERVRDACPPSTWSEVPARDGIATFQVPREELHGFLAGLRDRCGFDTSTLVTAIDHAPRSPRFEVIHQLLSTTHRDRARVSTWVGENDPSVPTACDLWPGVSFSERECYDMFGIRFEGHPDLRRLLMPEAYEHHPLRKDFPHQGIEPDKLYREWERSRSGQPR